jgi:8-oxo-dGTP pyrophosphatase MutT (NUDIX family)
MLRVSAVLLVDRRGWLLLQERDEHAPVAPDQWGLVGGQVEEGEDFEAAAYRELAEETGLVLTGALQLWRETPWRYPGRADPNQYSVWAAATDVTDADIVLGEGRQIVFVEPEQARALDLGGPSAIFVPEFLTSPTYRRLAAG